MQPKNGNLLILINAKHNASWRQRIFSVFQIKILWLIAGVTAWNSYRCIKGIALIRLVIIKKERFSNMFCKNIFPEVGFELAAKVYSNAQQWPNALSTELLHIIYDWKRVYYCKS